MILTPPLPSHDDMAMARTSPAERLRVDRMYAAACGIEPDAVDQFIARLALYDIREATRVEEEAITRLYAARAKRVEVESQGDLVRLRGQGVTRLSRRLPRPSPSRDAA